jgi:cell division protein FtsL
MRNRDFQLESKIVKGGFWFLFLLGLNVVSALVLVFATHELRQIHQSLDEAQRDETAELARHSRLLLEKSTLAGLNEVESIALRELGMEFPNNLAKPSQ